MASQKTWEVTFLLNSQRVVTHNLELSSEMDERETIEFITKQLDRSEWWFLEDGVALHTNRVECFYLENSTSATTFSLEK